MSLDAGDVKVLLEGIMDENTSKKLGETNSIKNLECEGENAKVKITLGYPAKNYVNKLAEQINYELKNIGANNVEVEIDWNIVTHSVQKSLKPMENIKNVIAVASGKIVARGCNHYRTYSKDGMIGQSWSCHAEIDVLRKCLKQNITKK